MAVLAAAALSLTCSSVEPSGSLAVNRVVAGQLSPADSALSYPFTADPGVTYLVLVQVTQGTLGLEIWDSAQTHLATAGQARVMSGPSTIDDHPVLSFSSPTGGKFVLKIRSNPAGSSASYSVLLRVLNPNPEIRPATYHLGDTVSGETIDPPSDQDIFRVTTATNQLANVFVAANGSSDMAPLLLTIQDSIPPHWATIAQISVPPDGKPVGIGDVLFQAGQQYRLTFQSGLAAPRLFSGSYRFWTSFINQAPEHRPVAIPVDSIVANEPIDFMGDVDTFNFRVAAPTPVVAFLQSARRLTLEVLDSTGTFVAGVYSAPSDTGMFDQYSARALLPAGNYVVRITDRDNAAVTTPIPYRFYIYAINTGPEHVSATLTPGDTVSGEALDLTGDIDTYTFPATAGDQYNVFVQSTTGSGATHLQALVLGPDSAQLGAATSAGTDTGLLMQATGPFRVATTGMQRVRVMGSEYYALPAGTGSYRLLLWKINPGPESTPDSLAAGDSIMGEAIEIGGDIDTWRVNVPALTGVNMVLKANMPPSNAIPAPYVSATLTNGSSVAMTVGSSTGYGTAPNDSVPAGQYTLTVRGAAYGGRVAYQLWLYAYQTRPETAPDTIAIGDTVSTEAIDVPGDKDIYHFYGTQGQDVTLQLQGLSNGASGLFQMGLVGGSSVVQSPLKSDSLSQHQTYRFQLPYTGWYPVIVYGGTDYGYTHSRDAYRLAVVPLDAKPEHVPAQITLGDSVTTERIDVLGDRDDFFVHAPPDSEVALVVGSPSTASCSYPWVTVMDSVTGDTLFQLPAVGVHNQPAFKVPASGVLWLKVWEYSRFCAVYPSYVGSYTIVTIPVHRGPEHASAAYTVGDTIRTEDLTLGDIDEFTSSGTPGDSMVAGVQLTAYPIPAYGGIKLEVIDAATGLSLTGSNTWSAGEGGAGGEFVVPASGKFIIRIQGGGMAGDIFTIAPYWFYARKLH